MSRSNLKQSSAKTNGFTLLEFMIVFSMIAILTLFTPVFFRAFEHHKLYSTASVIAADIRLAQQLNINQDAAEYTVLFDCVNERYYIQRGARAYKKVNLPYGVDLVATNFDYDNNPANGLDNKIRFNSKGEPCRSNNFLTGGHITVCNKNGEFIYIIVASITGRVRVDSKPPL